MSDLRIVLSRLPGGPVQFPMNPATVDEIEGMMKAVTGSCMTHLQFPKTHLLRNRREHGTSGAPVLTTFQNYLSSIRVPSHRRSYTRLLLSCHLLSVERLRYDERYRPHIPREWRLCRFCGSTIKNEQHALLICTVAPEILHLRVQFLQDIYQVVPEIRLLRLRLSAYEFLLVIIHRRDITPRVAKYIHDVLEIFYSSRFAAPQEIRSRCLTLAVVVHRNPEYMYAFCLPALRHIPESC
jgi:hypothetical protein